MKKIVIPFYLFLFFATSLFAQSKPNFNTVFNYYIACASGDTKTVNHFLKQYPDCVDIALSSKELYEIQDKGFSEHAYQRFANYLISNGFIPNFENKEDENEYVRVYKRYPLIIASQFGHYEIVKLLISYNTNLELTDEYGNTALKWASQKGYFDIVYDLVKHGANIYANHNMPIMNAARYGHKDILNYFIKNGININSKDSDGNSVLHYAASNNQLDILKFILKNRADINAKNKNGTTALMMSSIQGYIDIVKCLLKSNVDINAKDSIGRTALMAASSNGHLDIVKELLKHKATINEVTNYGETALMFAAYDNHGDIINELLTNHADTNKVTTDGWTALEYAIQNGSKEIVQRLIEYEADLLNGFEQIYLDIITALTNQQFDIACMILQDERYRRLYFSSGIHPTFAIGNLETTPLFYAVMKEQTAFIKLLLDNNVNPNETISSGITPLMLAANNCNFEIVNLLIDAGANINAKDNLGMSVLVWAIAGANELNDYSVASYLKYLGAKR